MALGSGGLRAPFFYKKPATVNLKSNSTVKSRYRMLAKYSNGVVVFDEFTDVPKNTNILVTQYNRDGYSRAATSNDNEVLETPVRANSLFIGNYLPESEPAAMSRLIILPFKKYEDKEKHFAFSDDRTEVVFRFSQCYRKAQESAIRQRRELVGKAMLKRLLTEHASFIKGNESARYRIKRGGILDLGFVVKKLPEDIKETLRGGEALEPAEKAESVEQPKGTDASPL